jgi:hypothetical protein
VHIGCTKPVATQLFWDYLDMDLRAHTFKIGDRVRAPRRPGFPEGTVMELLAGGFLLVRWGGQLLETAHHSDIATPALS